MSHGRNLLFTSSASSSWWAPNRFTGFPVFTYFDNCLPLFKHSFEARPLGSSSLAIFVCARWSALVLLPVPVWLVLLRTAWAVSSTSWSFGKKMGFGWFWHALAITAANLKIYPAGAHTSNIHHLFGLFCDQSVTRGAFGKILVSFGYRFGYRSAWAPSLQVTCVRDWMNSSPHKARPGSKTIYCMELATPACLHCLRIDAWLP